MTARCVLDGFKTFTNRSIVSESKVAVRVTWTFSKLPLIRLHAVELPTKESTLPFNALLVSASSTGIPLRNEAHYHGASFGNQVSLALVY